MNNMINFNINVEYHQQEYGACFFFVSSIECTELVNTYPPID